MDKTTYSTILLGKGAKYFEDQFMNNAMDRWDDIVKRKILVFI